MSRPLEEPDVTPLINVNLVILVMVLAIASHAARLLPLALPKAPGGRTEFVNAADAVPLHVQAANAYRLGDGAELAADALPAELGKLPEGTTVLVTMDPDAPYGALVLAIDHMLARPSLRVAFGQAANAARATAAPATD
jgi:biopolymer transport protein ExbD